MAQQRVARRRRYNDDSIAVWFYLVVIVLVIFVLPFGCGALVDESSAITTAEDVGWSEVEVVDKAVFWIELRGCGRSDDARFTVEGINPKGELRRAYVCDGVLKGGTFRSIGFLHIPLPMTVDS